MTSFVDPTASAVEYCDTMIQTNESLADQYYRPIRDHVQQKLWHQLTLTVLEFLNDPRATPETCLALYDKVVLAVDSKLHPLALGRIAAAVAQHLAAHDWTAACSVLENLLTKPLGVSAKIFVESKLSLLTLQHLDSNPNKDAALQSIRSSLQKNAATLNELADQTALVHAAHYEQACQYYKVVGPPEAFFEQAMRFLHYAPPTSEQTTTNYHQLAMDLCLAALTGEGVYNLSQVIIEQGNLLNLLNDQAWLVELLKACAGGQVTEFQQLWQQYQPEIAQQPALVHLANQVHEKLTLLALCDLIFSKGAHERHLDFDEIAQHLVIDTNQVEWIVMRALSVQLIQGSIDQVARTVHITWVVPRVLTNQQLQELAKRFGEWAGKTSRMKDAVHEQTATFAAA